MAHRARVKEVLNCGADDFTALRPQDDVLPAPGIPSTATRVGCATTPGPGPVLFQRRASAVPARPPNVQASPVPGDRARRSPGGISRAAIRESRTGAVRQ